MGANVAFLEDLKKVDGSFRIPKSAQEVVLRPPGRLGISGGRRLGAALKEEWVFRKFQRGTPLRRLVVCGQELGDDGGAAVFRGMGTFGVAEIGRAGELEVLDASCNDQGQKRVLESSFTCSL